jgi:hypothetical protein
LVRSSTGTVWLIQRRYGLFTVFIYFTWPKVFDQLEVEQFPNRDAKVEAMTCRLTALMNESQKHLMEFLDKQNVATNSFWISNTMLVENASLELLQQLEKMGGIKEIRKEMMATIDRALVRKPTVIKQ